MLGFATPISMTHLRSIVRSDTHCLRESASTISLQLIPWHRKCTAFSGMMGYAAYFLVSGLQNLHQRSITALTFLFSDAPLPARIPYLRHVRWAIDTVPISILLVKYLAWLLIIYMSVADGSGDGDTLTLYLLTRTDNEERIERKFPGADLVNANEVDIGAVVSTVDQVLYISPYKRIC